MYPHHEENWGDLPNEMKIEVVQNLSQNDRLNLRLCSRKSKLLVDSVPFRAIQSISLLNTKNEWKVEIRRSEYGVEQSLAFKSFEAFQKYVLDTIKNLDFIKTMTVTQTKNENQVQLTTSGKLVKVGILRSEDDGTHLAEIVRQIDPNHLKKLALKGTCLKPDFFDLPQVIRANISHSWYSSITDNQLLRLEGSKIKLYQTPEITHVGANGFLKQCVQNLSEKQMKFNFSLNDERPQYSENVRSLFDGIAIARTDTQIYERDGFSSMIKYIDSRCGNFQLKVVTSEHVIEGCTIPKRSLKRKLNQEEVQQKFRIVPSITICGDPSTRYELKVERASGDLNCYGFGSSDDLQGKLTRLLKRMNYIKLLCIENTSQKWNFRSSENEKVPVQALNLQNDQNVAHYLDQIDPAYVKEIVISETEEYENIYDMPQILRAKKIHIQSCVARDEQLLNLEAIELDLSLPCSENRSKVTGSGINELLKKRLLTLNKCDFNLTIRNLQNIEDVDSILLGLDIRRNGETFYRKFVVNSPYPEFQLSLTMDPIRDHYLEAHRIDRFEK